MKQKRDWHWLQLLTLTNMLMDVADEKIAQTQGRGPPLFLHI